MLFLYKITKVFLYGKKNNTSNHVFSMYINENVNSAVEYIRNRRTQDSNLRDIVIGLLQCQDSPYLFDSFRRSLKNIGFENMEDEIVTVFSCFKIAQIFSNGRWLWKRTRKQELKSKNTGLVQFSRGPLEEIPFIIVFAIKWLKSAAIDPVIYVNRINEFVIDADSVFIKLMNRLQEGKVNLLCDDIYTGLIRNSADYISDLEKIISVQGKEIAARQDQSFQLRQLLELPGNLKEISVYCDDLKEDTVNQVREIILDFYHRNWKLIKPQVDPGVLASVL